MNLPQRSISRSDRSTSGVDVAGGIGKIYTRKYNGMKEMKEYSIQFGDFTAIYVHARNADMAIRLGKIMDPEAANWCLSRRVAVTAREVKK